ETGFGYIEVIAGGSLRFIEKPDLDTAERLVNEGRSFWNSGMFCFAASTMLEQMRRLCPETLDGAQDALDRACLLKAEGRLTVEIDAARFIKLPSISIDYAIMEHVDNMALVPCECGWSD